ncbi:potassium-transporting ATPase subunit C [Mangrovactinospora gilvigrisea]|uniref:Potassium-transporting ATPase KdpC subunit n=1 Tax=Mangrovactinospora gilvigrisea TaxID=1428644 RepID=A0A1J7C983_9ACTN|nr:K(+)-transporting ATPase subunit C [Mangrovactinospora gilvigrisea]OIV38096.1 potassium-transporting ATPase subunit C [Mangrovactinospora gilvigrisea]
MAGTKTNSRVRVVWTGIRAVLVLTVVCGIVYPLVVTGLAQGIFHDKANGSIVKVDGKNVASSLVGQYWGTAKTVKQNGEEVTVVTPNPKWFQPRPSTSNYDPAASGASNLALSNPELTKTVEQRKADVAKFNGVSESAVPADAVTASGSSLDPQISPAYAKLQIDRVARVNHLSATAVAKLVDAHVQGRTLGILGDPRVNVLELNLALATMS